MIDHWSQILTVLISLYIYKNKIKEYKKKKREEKTNGKNIMKYL